MKKTPLPLGPFMSQAQALEEITSRLTNVHVDFHPTATPRETVEARLEGRDYHLRLGRGNVPEYVVHVGQEYDAAEEIRVQLDHGISPRVTFSKPQFLVHATGRGTYDGPQKLDQWMLISTKPQKGSFTVADGYGRTQGYPCDVVEGPFADNYGMAPELRSHHVGALNEWASERAVSPDGVLDEARDHGVPLCAR